MVCVKCGQELERGTKFCTKCGHKVIKTAVNNAQFAPVVDFTKETGIIIAAGVIIKLLVNFLVKGFYSFGNVRVGDVFRSTIFIKIIPIMNTIDPIINCVLFGLLAGIICQGYVLGNKENSILKNVAFVFLITFVSVYLIALIQILISAVIYSVVVINSRFGGNFFHWFIGFIKLHFIRLRIPNNFLPRWLLNNLKGGLITSSICSLASFAYLKWRAKKEASPV